MGVLRNSAGECDVSSECDNESAARKYNIFISKCYITSYNRCLSNANLAVNLAVKQHEEQEC